MIRKIVLALSLGLMLLLFGQAPAFAAGNATDAQITYTQGTRPYEVKINAELSANSGVEQYNFRVLIANQPSRTLTSDTPSVMLYNITPGTRIHAYLTLSGSGLDSSKVYDGGSYTQPEFTPGATPSASAPTASATPSTAPSATPSVSPSNTTPNVGATPSVSTPASTPAPSTAGRGTPYLVSFAQLHLGPIMLVAAITLALLGALTLFMRRRRQG